MPNFAQKFEPMWINRPKVGDFDVKFVLKYCGICHSDCHEGQNYLGESMYPLVPGHELCGTVTEVGAKVTKVKVGDNVGVGCIIDACLKCETCREGEEQYCDGCTHTYNSPKTQGHIGGNPDTQNFGGYSASNVVHEHFIIKIPDEVPLEKAGPLMCAAITMYDPLKYWGATKPGGKQMTIGIIGIGGLGTMGIKLAKAMGHKVYAVSTSPAKEAIAKEKGADGFIISTDPASMSSHSGKIDLLLSTISADHELQHYVSLLKSSGTMVMIGLVTKPHQVSQLPLIFSRKTIAGSLIGGINATQECIDFCGKNQIFPDI